MTSMWIENYNLYSHIGEYKGNQVVLGDLMPETSKIVNFPLSSTKGKVKMPLSVGVEILYDLFIRDIWNWFSDTQTQVNAFGYFTLKLIPKITKKDYTLACHNFWVQETFKMRDSGKLTN